MRIAGIAKGSGMIAPDMATMLAFIVTDADIHPNVLQALLGLPEPRYHHHRLLLAPDGRRLAKRDRAETLAALRAAGADGPALAARLADLAPGGPDCVFLP